MATSGTVVTNSWDGRYIELSWTGEELFEADTTTGNITYYWKIDWIATTRGGNQSTYPTALCYFEVDNMSGAISGDSHITVIKSSSKLYKKDEKLGRGTFTFNIADNGTAAFAIRLYAALTSTTATSPTHSGGNSWSLDRLPGKCGAPILSVTTETNTLYITPELGKIILSWSDATSGYHNTINGYNIYYYNDITSYLFDDIKTTDSFGTFTYSPFSPEALETMRGERFKLGIQTLGNSGRYSDIVYTDWFIINQLPGIPTVSSDKSIVKSSGDTITLTASYTPTTDTDQTYTFYYTQNSPDNEKILMQNNEATLNIAEATNLYVFTYDGLEFSDDSTEVSIEINEKPILTINFTSTSYWAKGVTRPDNSLCGGWRKDVEYQCSTNKDGQKVTLYMTVEVTDVIDPWPDSPYNKTTRIKLEDGQNNGTVDIEKVIAGHYATNITKDNWAYLGWRILCYIDDGIETSDIITYPTSNNSNGIICYATPGAVDNIINKFNQCGVNASIEGTKENEMYKEVRIEYDNDESITSYLGAVATINDKTVSCSFERTTSDDNKIAYFDIWFGDSQLIPSGATIDFEITELSEHLVKRFTFSMIETHTLDFSAYSPNYNAPTIAPFTASEDNECNITWPFQGFEDLTTALQYYNCDTDTQNSIKLLQSTSTSFANDYDDHLVLTWQKNNDTLETQVKASEAYDFRATSPYALNMTTYQGIRPYYMIVRITNLFGQTFDSAVGGPYYFDFDELARNLNITSVNWKAEDTKWATFNMGTNGNQIQQDLYVKFNFNYDTYTAGNYTLTLNCNNTSVLTNIISLDGATSQEIIEHKDQELIYGPFNEITSSDNLNWTISITNSKGSVNTDSQIMRVFKQTAPTITLKSCKIVTVNNVKQLSTIYNCSDVGLNADDNYTVQSCIYNTNDEVDFTDKWDLISNIEDVTQNKDMKSISSDWDYKTITISTTSKPVISDTNTGPLLDLDRTYLSNIILLYNLTPLVAYRKGYMGINTDEPATDSILDIHASSGNKYIIIHGEQLDTETQEVTQYKYIIDTALGSIGFYTYDEDTSVYNITHAIDFVNGELN